jgi:signal transduction histidine kinase
VDVAELLAEIVARLSPDAHAAGLRIELDREGVDEVEVLLDRSALEQVLINLVDNACKYAASSEPAVIHVELQRRQGRTLIRVRDHGPGLTQADRRRLFREFSKSDREAASSRPGVGLGLALSRRLMRAQGGDLAFDDAVKDGAAFVVALPR